MKTSAICVWVIFALLVVAIGAGIVVGCYAGAVTMQGTDVSVPCMVTVGLV